MLRFKDYFYGNKISDYGLEHGRVDYRTFAKAFDAVLNNNIMEATQEIGYWEQEAGYIDNTDRIDEISEKIEELRDKIMDLRDIDPQDENEEEKILGNIEDLENKINVLEDEIEELEEEQYTQPDVFQWYIISDQGAEICKEFNEVVFYNAELDIYLWGVTHYGTAWDYVLTDIECEKVTA